MSCFLTFQNANFVSVLPSYVSSLAVSVSKGGKKMKQGPCWRKWIFKRSGEKISRLRETLVGHLGHNRDTGVSHAPGEEHQQVSQVGLQRVKVP